MNIQTFTQKFHQIEVETEAFEFKDQAGIHYWDAVRSSVFQHIYKKVKADGSYSSESEIKGSKLKRWIKPIISKCAKYLVIKYFKYSQRKVLFVKCSRTFVGERWQDNISSQISSSMLNDKLEIETCASRNSIIHTRYLFHYTSVALPVCTKQALKRFSEAVQQVFGAKIELSDVVSENLSIFYTELDFYRSVFTKTKIAKVFLVQNGIQKGLFKAAIESNIEVNEFQHGYIGFAQPAYSYPNVSFHNDNLFLPYRLLTFSDFWQHGYYFPVKEFVVIGSSNHKEITTVDKLSEYVLVVSANIYHDDLLHLTKKLSSDLSGVTFKYKLHPNQFHQINEIKDSFVGHKNIEVIGPELGISELLKYSLHVLCIQSTAVYEALQSGSFVYCYKRHNYNNHDNVIGSPGFFLIDSAHEFVQLMNVNNMNSSFQTTNFFSPYNPESVKYLL
ncbi:MAG: hypothetical protein RPR97_11195 [Colwellia sp.]